MNRANLSSVHRSQFVVAVAHCCVEVAQAAWESQQSVASNHGIKVRCMLRVKAEVLRRQMPAAAGSNSNSSRNVFHWRQFRSVDVALVAWLNLDNFNSESFNCLVKGIPINIYLMTKLKPAACLSRKKGTFCPCLSDTNRLP